MKHIIKVASLNNLPETRPLIAMDDEGNLFAEGQAAGPQMEFVDLGLSVKWGTRLIDATNGDTSTSWYGNYYAWGETETKLDYSWATYAFGASTPFSKYDTDGKTVLESEDDIATATNSVWRMPTQEELNELLDATKVTNIWINNYDPTKSEHTPADDGGISGLNGRLFTSKINGNTLFIPAAGYRGGSRVYRVGSDGYLWSLNLSLSSHGSAYYLGFSSDGFGVTGDDRYSGFSVCPVC